MYTCKKCGAAHKKWAGKCFHCKEWETIIHIENKNNLSPIKNSSLDFQLIGAVNSTENKKILSEFKNFNRVCGGGLTLGASILLCGAPGVGKSTLMLKILAQLSNTYRVAYISAEETNQQISFRGKRLGIQEDKLLLANAYYIENIIESIERHDFDILLIDSVQTIKSSCIEGYSGSISQVKFCSEKLITFCKSKNIILFLIGHVTKDGHIAGPKTLEHMVDTVLYLEKDNTTSHYILSTNKNRFGSIEEIAFLTMTKKGIEEIDSPSNFFIESKKTPQIGNCIFPTIEGSKCFLVEIQTLVSKSFVIPPKRAVVGLNPNRLAIILAILETYCKIPISKYDVFINIGGGAKINETAADLPIAIGILSSLYQAPLSADLVAFGEISLSGNIKSVNYGNQRLEESKKLGFQKSICPMNQSIKVLSNIQPNLVAELPNIIKNF